MTRNRIAIATFERLPNLSPDDQLLQQGLARLGLIVEAAVWSDGSVDWSRFSSIVIRSCWDYHHRHEAFLEWLIKIEELGLSIWNRPTLIRWNIDKIYLRELQEKGFQIPPTVWVEKGDSIDVREVLRSQSWRCAVLKPRVSASGTGHCTGRSARTSNRSRSIIFAGRAALIQEFLDVVGTEGEWSLLFFNKKI